MKILFKILVLIFFYAVNTYGQVIDTSGTKNNKDSVVRNDKADSLAVFYHYRFGKDTAFKFKNYRQINTLRFQHLYDQVNTFHRFPATLGNLGLASYDLFFKAFIFDKPGFDLGLHSYDAYLFKDERIKIYNVKKPYTEINAILSMHREQMISVSHYQNIKNLLNIGINYRVISSAGEFPRQRADDNSFSLIAEYNSKNKKYKSDFSLILNRIKAQENGGITDSNENRRLITEFNLSNALHKLRETSLYTHHIYQLSGRDDKKKNSAGYLTFDATYKRHFQTYNDLSNNWEFYRYPYFDTLNTNDSIIYSKFENKFKWIPILQGVKVYAGISWDYVRLYNKYSKSEYLNYLKPSVGFSTKENRKIELKGNFEYAINNISDNEYKLEISAKYRLDKEDKHHLNIYAYNLDKAPEYFMRRYLSNYFTWNNKFENTKTVNLLAEYKFKGLKLGFEYKILNDYIFFNEEAKPQQANEEIVVNGLFINSNLMYWDKNGIKLLDNITNDSINSYRIYFKAVWQSSSKEYIHLPRYLVYGSTSYNFSMFRKALFINAGIDFWYTSSYYANFYMPATTIFYLQDEIKLKENISIDPFIQFKIKRANIFVKYQHINYLIKNERNYAVPYQPLKDAAFKFGVNWIFFD